MLADFGKPLVALWFALLLWLLVLRGPDDPPSSPAGALALVEYPQPLTYEERFSPEALGPSVYDTIPRIGSDWAWAEAACVGCPIATAAVYEQGVGE